MVEITQAALDAQAAEHGKYQVRDTTLPTAFRAKCSVTLRQLKLEPKKPANIRFDGPIYLGEPRPLTEAQIAAGEKQDSPPHLAHVTDLATAQPACICVPAIAVKELEKKYPENSYVGRFFSLTIFGKLNGKRYNTVEVIELEPDDSSENDHETEAAATKSKNGAPKGRK